MCPPVIFINLINFVRIFGPILCCHILWRFLEMCVFCFLVFAFALLLLLFSFFTFGFISGQNYASGSKDTAATTVALELIIRTIIALL